MTYLPFPDFDPALFTLQLGDFSFSLRWYALAYIAGLLLGWQIIVALVKRPKLWAKTPPMSPPQVEELLTWIILSVIIGGRLGFVLFYQPAHFLANPLDILKIWEGGMSFHGGFAGVLVGGLLFCRKHGLSPLSVGDCMAFVAPIGIFFGRVANFINGELWGRPTLQPWGMVFPDPRAQVCPPGWEGPCGRHPSQLYEAASEGVLLFAVMVWLVWRMGALKHPGRLIAVFFLGYGVARFVCEGFRQGDAQFVTLGNPFGEVFLGFTMGQMLSLPMVAIGLGLMLWLRGRKSI